MDSLIPGISRWSAVVATAAAALVLASSAAARPGDLDPSFGEGGIVNAEAEAPPGCRTGLWVWSLAFPPGGAILAGGEDSIRRFDANGVLDPGFPRPGSGTGQDLRCPVDGSGVITSLGLDAEGRIVIVGSGGARRIGADGGSDIALGANSARFSGEPTGGGAIMPDGRIVLAGTSFTRNPIFARYLPGGRPDRSFGIRGVARVRSPYGRGAPIEAMALQPDGGVLGVGYARNRHGDIRIYLVRLRPDGIRDRRFGPAGNGVATVSAGEFEGGVSVEVRPDGKIVVLGGDEYESLVLARFNRDGSLDTGFGRRGVFRSILPAMSVSDMALDGGRILVVGWGSRGCAHGKSCIVLTRHTPRGGLDRSFGVGGIVRTSVGREAFGAAVGLQADGRIVVGGATNLTEQRTPLLVRYMSD